MGMGSEAKGEGPPRSKKEKCWRGQILCGRMSVWGNGNLGLRAVAVH